VTIDRRHFLTGAALLAAAACSGSDRADDPQPSNNDTGATDGGVPELPMSSQTDVRVETAVIEEAVEAAGSADIPAPDAAIITRWRQDPFARGSYSYLPAGFDPAARTALRSDVEEQVFFAGEATSDDYAGTVHGALFEGTAAADRIAAVASDGDEIAIIGAGIAGLAAAKQLTDAGFAVFVLEGRDRIGGRLHTDESLGVPVELGAGWIHGADDNPLLELAERAGTRTLAVDDNVIVYDTDGDEVDADDVDQIVEAFGALVLDDDRTLANILADLTTDADQETAQLARYVLASLVEHDEAASIDDLTPASIDLGEEFDGADVVLPDGYVRILGPLLDGVAIDVGQVVESITHDADGVLIGLEGGAAIRSDRVLVTVPLGVLKAGDITFDPPLPTEKRTAIEELGMGVLDRVVLRFDERFWDDTTAIGFVGNEPGLFIEWYDLTDIVGEPVIVGFNAGNVADALAVRSDQDIIEAAMRSLAAIYGP
jgi:monoamine oxidase